MSIPKCLSVALVGFALLLTTNVAHAQRGAGHASGAVMGAFPHSSFRATGSHTRSTRSVGVANGNFGATSNFGNFGLGAGGINTNPIYSLPGVGFNFGNNWNLGTEAQIDPVTRANLSLALKIARVSPKATFFPFFADTYPSAFVAGGEDSQPPQPQQPQVIVVQASPATSAPAQQQAEAAAPPPQPPLPDVGSFTLVLHNGTQISAIAFTRQGNHIIYIANDGTRHSIALSDIDRSATQEINEEKGTPVNVPMS